MPVAVSGSYKMFKELPPIWGVSSPSLNLPRQDFGAAGDIDNALVFGGAGYSTPSSTQFALSCTEEWNGTSWSTVDNIPSGGRGANAGFGTSTSAVTVGGAIAVCNLDYAYRYYTPSSTYVLNDTNLYNGTSWSTAANTINTRWARCGVGTQNAGSVLAGRRLEDTQTNLSGSNADCKVEWYDGVSWSSRPDLNWTIVGNTVVGSQGEEFTFGGAFKVKYSNLYGTILSKSNCYRENNANPSCYANGYANQMSVGGISWSNEPDLNKNRAGLSGAGTQNSAIAVGGGETISSGGVVTVNTYTCVEEWNGITWSNINPDSNVLPEGRNLFKLVGNIESLPLNYSSSLMTIGGNSIYNIPPDSGFTPGFKSNISNYQILASNNEPTNSISHGLEEGGSLGNPTQFNSQIADSTASIYDTTYASDINTIADVSESLQWRNYPVQEQCIVSASFEEIFYPGNNTSSIEVTLRVDKIDNNASGSVESGSFESVEFLVLTGSENSSITASASVGPNSTFVGWSSTPVYNVPRIFRKFKPLFNIIETSTVLQINLEEENQNYWAVFDFDVIEKKYCYTTSSNRNDICLECQEEKTIYFNRTNYKNTGSEDITWYEDINLSTTASDGYYYLSGSENPIVYDLTTGSAEFELICEGDVIYCS